MSRKSSYRHKRTKHGSIITLLYVIVAYFHTQFVYSQKARTKSKRGMSQGKMSETTGNGNNGTQTPTIPRSKEHTAC